MIKYKLRKWTNKGATLLIVIGLSCNPENDLNFPSYKNYFPLKTGDYRIYKVDETQITPFNIETQFTYEIKTLVTDSISNSEGAYSYIISRFKRTNTSQPWSSLDTWFVRADEKEVVISEDNVPYVRLSFPVISGKAWNGNAYNHEMSIGFCTDISSSCDLYAFNSTETEYVTSNGQIFNNSIEVVENDDPDIFTKYDVRKTIYAFGVGIVNREINVLTYCTTGGTNGCYGKQLVENGTVVKMELTEYGHE